MAFWSLITAGGSQAKSRVNSSVVAERDDWLMRDGITSSVECVDILHFTEEGHIKKLRIIYDTQNTRKAFDQLR